MKKQLTTDNIFYATMLLIFMVVLPIGNLFGFVSTNTISLWGRYFCFAIAALGVDLIWGYTGILSMCQAFFFCIGGYSIAMHMLLAVGGQGVYGAKIPDFMIWNQVTTLPTFWEPFHSFGITMILALLLPALFAGIFGFFVFRSRIKGVYFAIITQALAFAVWLIFLRNETMLGGTNGLTDFKSLLGFQLSQPGVKLGLYMISLLALCLAYFVCYKLVKSKFGKVLVAVLDSESRVSYTAYIVQNYKIAVFVISAVITSNAGILYAPQTGIITPGLMDVKSSIEMVMWVALGGRGSLKGAIVGALLVNYLYSLCTSMFPESWPYILGVLFILTVLFFQKGFWGLTEIIERKFAPKLVEDK
jgi:urea transport system permease protein